MTSALSLRIGASRTTALYSNDGAYTIASRTGRGCRGGLMEWLYKFIAFSSTVDLFCPECKNLSVFTHAGDKANTPHARSPRGQNHIVFAPPEQHHFHAYVSFICARSAGHLAWVNLLLIDGKSLEKVGQFPSLADLSDLELNAYEKVLGDERLRELKRGVGLRAHGIGIGSTIYLRRALEFIVDAAEQVALSELGKSPCEKNERMQEKIRALAAYLPDFISENRAMYGLLSDGIHNRSEEECTAMFAPCYDGIVIALEQMEVKRAQAERSKKAKTDLSAVAAQLAKILPGNS